MATGIERIARKNVKEAFTWITEEYWNLYELGYEEEIPPLEDVKEQVYNSAINDNYCTREGWRQFGAAPREMRFATTKFIKDYIEELFSKSSLVYEIWMKDGYAKNHCFSFEE